MGKIQKGKNLMVSLGGTIYGFATSCDINIDVDTEEVSTGSYKHQSVAGQWKEYEAKKMGWTVSTAHLATVSLQDEQALFALMTAGEALDIEFEAVTSTTGITGAITPDTAKKGWKGKAIINSFKLSAQNDNDATYDISLQGTGSLSIITTA